MEEPVKPFTTAGAPALAPGLASKNARAIFAVSASCFAARLRTPSGFPSPQIAGDKIDLCRSSIRSQTACPTRWLEMAWQDSP